jgi:hypothetical protein
MTIGPADTDIPLVDASEFPDAGVVQIGDEVIPYDGKSGNVLLNAVRGAGASAHGQGALVRFVPDGHSYRYCIPGSHRHHIPGSYRHGIPRSYRHRVTDSYRHHIPCSYRHRVPCSYRHRIPRAFRHPISHS